MRSLDRRLAAMLMGATMLTVGMATTGSAQDATGSPAVPQTCGVLTADEVSTAMGMTVTVAASGDTDCEFDSDYTSGTYLSLFTSLQSGDLESIRTLMCSSFGASPEPTVSPTCAIDLQVAGQPAIYMPNGMGTLLYVASSPGVLFSLQMVGEPAATVDKQAAIAGLAELAVPRLAAFPQPTQEPTVPQASFTADKDLEALFPTQVGGQQVTIQSMSGQDVESGGNAPEALTKALEAQGKTLRDVSIAYGYYPDSASSTGSGIITAFQVKGVDMASLTPVLIPLITNGVTPASQTQAQIGGKDVTVIKTTADTTVDEQQYLYPRNDILWVVQAIDPGLTEIFTGLP